MSLLALCIASQAGCSSSYDSWADYAATLKDQHTATGSCSAIDLTNGAMRDGKTYPLEPRTIDMESAHSSARFLTYSRNTSLHLRAIESSEDVNGCIYTSDALVRALKADDIGVDFATEFDAAVSPPLFEYSGSPLARSSFYFNTTPYVVASGNEPEIYSGADSLAWICVDSVQGPAGAEAGPAHWKGVLWIHTELWADSSGNTVPSGDVSGVQLPLDVVLRLGTTNCSPSEDASWFSDPKYCYNWSGDCDGLDNDYDGEVDEYLEQEPGEPDMDLDDNGIFDCMDDKDGDGEPNWSEGDACCCDDI